MGKFADAILYTLGNFSDACRRLSFVIFAYSAFSGILNMPLLKLVPDVIQLTCMIVMNLNHEIPPPVVSFV